MPVYVNTAAVHSKRLSLVVSVPNVVREKTTDL